MAVDRKQDIIYVHIYTYKIYISDISYAADIPHEQMIIWWIACIF